MRGGEKDGSATRMALRLGFRLIHGMAEKHAETVVRARRNGPFRSFADFVARTGLRAPALRRLSQADAFGSLGLDRQSTLWQSLPERGPVTEYDRVDPGERPVQLPPLAPLEEVLADYRAAGLTLREHPVSFLRSALDALGIVTADRLPGLANDRKLSVAGLVLCRQRPSTASGVTFVTLEDETGIVNLIVHKGVWERYRRVARTAVAMIAHGRLQIEAEVIHVLVTRMEDLTDRLAALSIRSRDFH
jgi:error-prone DNA polymerase